MEKLGSGLLRTLAFTQLTMAPIKLAVLHERSDGRYRRSFPSGSTARNVAMGTALGILVGNSTMLEKTNKIEVAPTSNSLLLRVKF